MVLEFVVLVAVTFVVVTVVVPLGLCYLLVRQVRRSRWVGRVTRAAGAPARPRLGRQWSHLAAEAVTAGERYRSAVSTVRQGPLRDSLAAAEPEVRAAIAEAQRLAERVDHTQRAHRELVAALQRQQRRRGDRFGLDQDVQASIAAAARAQHDSAHRLAVALRRDRSQLELLVARLHELVAHAFEIGALAAPAGAAAAGDVADRVAALRVATVELNETVTA
ncbi:MAG: hypothetical protein GEU74_15550 [Nitriliruptorales bacterium]|nr:hypothetical protein [Nitriliruptorales bacterium]